MRLRNLSIAAFLLILCLLIPTISIASQYKVTRVYDGDSLVARGQDGEITVRLVGIDAPETSKGKRQPGQPFSQTAKKHLTGLVLNRSIEVKRYGEDRYGRILGVVFLDGKNINLEMVRTGMAEVYRGKPQPGFDLEPYQQAEEEARKPDRGMWAQGRNTSARGSGGGSIDSEGGRI